MAEDRLKLPHKLILNERSALTMTGVTEVVSFDDSCVVMRTDLGDLIVLGFDDSTRVITPAQLDALREALAGDKPLIILLHIPFAVPENEAMLRGCGEYFMLNYDGCPAENTAFVELITSHPHRIVAVLAGHLHFNHTCPVAEGLTQYVSSQGMTGHINRYVIGA